MPVSTVHQNQSMDIIYTKQRRKLTPKVQCINLQDIKSHLNNLSSIAHLLQPGVNTVFKKIGHDQNEAYNVK